MYVSPLGNEGTLAVELVVLERAGVRAAIDERDPAQRRPQYL